MLKVTVELIPRMGEPRTLGTMLVANKIDLAEQSSYDIAMAEGENPVAKTSKWSKTFKLRHNRVDSVWNLIGKAIEEGLNRDVAQDDSINMVKTRKASRAKPKPAPLARKV